MMRLEFWPDYGSGPLWSDEGKAVALGPLGISPVLAERVRLWNSQYEEGKIPIRIHQHARDETRNGTAHDDP